jgi:hypothetical protein
MAIFDLTVEEMRRALDERQTELDQVVGVLRF